MKKIIFTLIGLLSINTLIAAEELIVKLDDNRPPPPQLGISPPLIEKKLIIGEHSIINQSIVLYNYNTKPKTISVEIVDVNKNKQPITPNKKTLAPWILLNPKSFTIPNNGQQTIRLSIRLPMGFPKKTHYAMLKIEQSIPEPLKFDPDGKGAVVKLGASYGLPLIIQIK